ncbi:hypothetical protein C1I98_11085 [Spongiactinospora gelatinilytica]|uniref:Uncharacterized protein n=1 Tax=Spongiactinospora gelatinilytica TaxID=2666298 RepID=A0A2W2GPQ2_9ACTN|nr:hypothetical protein [Spongiactinospora gelatinilytica]PZG49852.1 hypothetical protein C1I98_11085 [Spongiactinospora gelatinilytica]
MTPPIPLRLAGRPTQGGLVVPWISIHHADGRATLGAVHGSRVDTCLRSRCCQTCGEHLGYRLVVLARLATDRAGKLLGIALGVRPLKMRRVGSREPTPEQAALALLLDMPGGGAQ